MRQFPQLTQLPQCYSIPIGLPILYRASVQSDALYFFVTNLVSDFDKADKRDTLRVLADKLGCMEKLSAYDELRVMCEKIHMA